MARREGSTDPRAVRTRKAFLTATRDLQLEHKTEDITVSAIVKRAGMSRQVFYEHYDGRDAVLVSGMYEERDLLLNVVGGPALPAVLAVFTTPEQPMLRSAVESLQERMGEIDPQHLEDLGDLLRAGAFRLLVKCVRESDSAEEAAARASAVLDVLREAL